MARSKSDFEFRQQASLSQQLADTKEGKIYQKLAGSDPNTSRSIGVLLVLGKLGYIDLENPTWKLTLELLDAERKALFATSPHTNEITKMGLQMPRSEAVYYDE